MVAESGTVALGLKELPVWKVSWPVRKSGGFKPVGENVTVSGCELPGATDSEVGWPAPSA